MAESKRQRTGKGEDAGARNEAGPTDARRREEETRGLIREDAPPPWPGGVRLSRNPEQTCSIPSDLAVVLSQRAFTELFGYAYATTLEISCLGVVRKEGAVFRVERFHLVKQTSSTGHTELDNEALSALIEGLIGEGARDEVAALKCWAHSHPGFKCFWSKTDDETCARLVTDWLVSLVVSNDFDIRCRIDVGGPVPFTIDQVPVFVEMPAEETFLDKLKTEARQLVVEGLPLLKVRGGDVRSEKAVAAEEYCDLCGSWHRPDRCPFDDWPSFDWGDEDSAADPPGRSQLSSAEPCLPGLEDLEP